MENEKKEEKVINYDLITVLEHYSNSRDIHFSVEFRPNAKKLPSGEWNHASNRLWPEDSWTSIKRVEVHNTPSPLPHHPGPGVHRRPHLP